MKIKPFLPVVLLLSGLLGVAEAADPFSFADSDQPLEITSERLEVYQDQQKSIFSGDVVARQGEMTLYSERLTVMFDEQNEVRSVEATGSVRIEDPLRRARGDQAVFDRAKNILVLSGKAQVEQGGNRINGDEITLFVGENRSIVKGGDGGRVRAVIIPEKEPIAP